jgi:hypothetical protein
MNFIDIALFFTYAILGIGILSVTLIPLYNIIRNPKNAKTTIIGIIAIAIAYLICFILSSGELYAKFPDITVGISKGLGGGIILLYSMVVASFASIVFYEIYKLIK